jgi:hypothetical protein
MTIEILRSGQYRKDTRTGVKRDDQRNSKWDLFWKAIGTDLLALGAYFLLAGMGCGITGIKAAGISILALGVLVGMGVARLGLPKN